jgi:uncharacterized cupredoxin-like copper-binding protein
MNALSRLFSGPRGGRLRRLSPFGLAIVAVAMVATSAITNAQNETPVVTSVTESQTFSAAIYNGTCTNLGLLAFPLAQVGLPEGSTTIGQEAVPAYTGTTELEAAALSDLINGPFSLAVSAVGQGDQPVVACGGIGGTQDGDTLLFGLLPTGDSGYAGVAVLSQAPSSSTLNAVVYLTPIRPGVATPAAPSTAASPSPAAQPATETTPAAPTTPAATQTASTPASGGGQVQTQVTVTLNDIYFNPNVITIPANTPVTFVLENKGAASHNFSVTDHNNTNVQNLNISVDVAPGQTQQTTINAPAGTYYFYCNVPGHEQAGMYGYLIVQDGAAIATQEATVTPPTGS